MSHANQEAMQQATVGYREIFGYRRPYLSHDITASDGRPLRHHEKLSSIRVGQTSDKISQSLQLGVLRLGFFHDCQIGVGVFPESQKLLVCGPGFCRISL